MADILLARALNSTIGTPDFKGFDEIYQENSKNVRLVGSNETFFVYDGKFSSEKTDSYIIDARTTDKYIKFDTNGSVNANAYVRFYNSSSSSTAAEFTLKVLDESGKIISEKDSTASVGNQKFSYDELNTPFNVTKNSKYKISVETSTRSIDIRTLIISINASIVPATSFCMLSD